jgi:hypothetical protein
MPRVSPATTKPVVALLSAPRFCEDANPLGCSYSWATGRVREELGMAFLLIVSINQARREKASASIKREFRHSSMQLAICSISALHLSHPQLWLHISLLA